MTARCHLADVTGPEHAELTLTDGVVLAADIYRPTGTGPWPVLLMRQPYGRRIASTVVLAHPAWYAAQGYLVVVQDVRGCGESSGVFEPFVNEASDGAASVAWARGLRGSNGRLGMYGFSYQATTQYLALAGGARPDALAPAMGSWHPGRDWLRKQGLEKRAKVGDALRGGISRRCRVAVNSLLRKGYATCQRLPSPNCPIHRDLAPTRSLTFCAMARAS